MCFFTNSSELVANTIKISLFSKWLDSNADAPFEVEAISNGCGTCVLLEYDFELPDATGRSRNSRFRMLCFPKTSWEPKKYINHEEIYGDMHCSGCAVTKRVEFDYFITENERLSVNWCDTIAINIHVGPMRWRQIGIERNIWQHVQRNRHFCGFHSEFTVW